MHLVGSYYFYNFVANAFSRSTSLNQCRSRFAIFSSSQIVYTATLCLFPSFIFSYCQLTLFALRSDLPICMIITKAVQNVGCKLCPFHRLPLPFSVRGGGPLGRAPLLWTLRDVLRKALDTGISLHRGPIREPGGDSLTGTFERKGLYIWVPFLDPEDIKILSLGNFSKGTGLF